MYMRSIFFLFSLITVLISNSQTLYWVGGSGNFNDPKHWSLTSNGATANFVPNSNTDVVFDDASSNYSNPIISFVGTNYCKSLKFTNEFVKYTAVGSKFTEIHIGGDFELPSNTNFAVNSRLIFNSSSNQYNNVRFNLKAYEGDVDFNGGNWNIKLIHIGLSNKLNFNSGNYSIISSNIKTGNFYAANNTNFEFKSGNLDVANILEVKNGVNFKSENFLIKARQTDASSYKIDPGVNFGNGYKILNSVSAVCAATLSSVGISCAGVCDGKLILSIDPTCAPGPYNLVWSNGGACPLPTLTAVPGAGSYTISNLCSCADFYDVTVFTGTVPLAFSNFTNVAGVSAIGFTPFSFVSPTCFGFCNGSVTGNLGGSVAPYTVTVNGTSTVFVNSGINTFTNLCGGTNTLVVTDTKGCVRTFTPTLTQPPQLLANPVTQSVTCNSFCNGFYSISPQGGTSNYTVNFSTGPSFTLAANSTASITNLCPGAISATLTDAMSCTVSVNTTIVQPSTVSIVPSQTNVTCFGLCNATASVSMSGGIAPYTFTWSSAPSTTNVATGLCAGSQTVTIQNNSGLCTNTVVFSITQPSSITITPTITNVSCPGGSNGSATVSVTGGAGPFTFTWVAPSNATISNTSSITGQPAGVYTVFVTNTNSCSASAQVTLTAPPAFTLTSATASITCFSTCSGGATVTVEGGTGPYTFTWTPSTAGTVAIGSGTTTGSNLCAGNYTVSITDASTCFPTPVTFTISQAPGIIPNITTTSLSCNNVCNGSINANPTNGVGVYSFTLVTPTSASITGNPPFTGLCVGNYTLFIQDANCTQSFTTSLSQPNALVASVNSSSVTCFNVCNGSLSGSVLGGTPGYTLSWTTPTGTVSGGVIGAVCANTVYIFNATDANGCTVTQTASINQPTSSITATINQTPPACSTSSNGSLSGVVAGGTPGYTLNWSNGVQGNPNSGLSAGNYTLTVTDANGCTGTFTTSLVAPSTITVSATTASPTCAGSTNGSATITASGGTPGFTFQVNSTTNTTGIFVGLGPGNYIASATDANGCSQSINFSISNPPLLSVSVVSLQSSCNTCGGGATVTPSGGIPGYTVNWANAGGSVGTGTVIGGLCVGNYTATVTDANGCSATTTAGIVQTVTVSVVTGGTGIQCFGACTGSAVASPLGGASPYTYTWNTTGPPPQSTQTATNLCAGNYTVIVQDNNGCSNTGTINLANPPAITVNTTQTNATCFGICDGAISATASGGTGALSYSWSPGSQTTSAISNLCSGGYTLTVTDQNNCPRVLTFSVTQSNSLSATFTTTSPTGCGATNGSICVTPSGGTGSGYTFTWSPVTGTNSCLTGLGAGVYSVMIENAGCTASLSALLSDPSGPALTITTSSVACNSNSTGAATVVANGVPTYSFAWSPAVPFVTIGNTSTASSLNSGTYAITVTQSNSCITTQTINIGTAPAFTVSSAVTNPKCNAFCNGSITLNVSGGTPGAAPGYTYAWTSATVTGATTSTVTNLCAGVYTVNVTDANACLRTQTFSVVNPALLTLTNTPTNVKCFGACNGSIVATAAGGTAPLSYSWVPVGSFSVQTTATVLNLCPNVYTVMAIDGNSCTTTNTINITEPPLLTSTLTSLNTSCSNSCNATATHVASGGTTPYGFIWTNSVSTTSVATGLCAGTYSATITDLNGCAVGKSFTVTAPAPFTATLASTSPLCNGLCNGSITTSLSGAQGTVNFNWSPAGTGQNPINLCANNYTLIATDSAGCQLSGVATLTNPPAVIANITSTNPACNAFCNGAALSTPANAVGVVSYSWITATGPSTVTTQSINSLCAGNYTAVVQDQNGCQDVQTFTLTNPPLLNINASSSPASCSVTNGAITVLVSGGTPTYNFVWSPSVSTSSTASGLGAGVYTIVVSDQNNCTNTVSIPLSNSNGPSSAPITSSSVNCSGLCTGAASINPAGITGGTPGYTISWVPPSTSSVNPLTNLCAGSYTAQITDQLSCILFTAVTISQPAPITVNPNVGLPTCNGVCDGSISIATNGGTPGYNFVWSPAAANSSVITNVCAGIHTVQVLDNLGCSITQTINVPSVANIAITAATSSNICFGTCIAGASISIANAFPPTNITWSNGQSGSSASSLCNGIYTVVVSDSKGCVSSATTNIISPAQITATNAITPPLCNLCDGVSIATATGGVGPYTYSWTSGANTPTASNLCAGLYQVLVTDNVGCSQTINVPISNVPGITGEIFTIQNEGCEGTCNGSATVQATGGSSPITYTWLTSPVVTNSVITALCSGDYFVQMMDQQGCIRTSSTTIGSSPGLTLSPFISAPGCGLNNGTISIVPSGGVGPYSYTWIPSGGTSSLTNIGPGNYTVTVTDLGSNCFKTQAFTLSNLNNPSLTYTQTNVDCFGACTGSIVAVATTTAAGTVTLNWSTGVTNTSTLTSVCPGIITLTATSSDGCIALQSFTITDNPALQLSISNVQNVKCFGDCDGQVTLIPSGGVLPYTFTWSPSGTSNPQFSLCAGSYSATVRDSKGCNITTTASISGPTMGIAITNTVTNSSCSTAADGSASVTIAGGTPSYTFNWTGPASFTSTLQNLTGILAGTYSLNTTDANGCTRDTVIQIVPTITVTAEAGRDSIFCTTSSIVLDGSGSIGASGGFNWTALTNSTTIANTATVSVTPAVGSNTYVLLVVSSVSTCVDRDTVVVQSLPLPNVDAGPSFTIPVFSSVTIGGNPTSPTGITFTWTPGLTLNDTTIANPTASNTLNTTYTVTVTDANGCKASDTVQVFLYPEVVIPNGFSPNGDSKNEMWIIDNISQFPECVVEVYNRWGELLFNSTGYNTPFDGRFQGKELPVGTYYYIINLNHPAYTKPYTGPLTIFR